MSVDHQLSLDAKFPCSLVISVPFPNARLASTALRALRVDEELSSLVTRSFSLRRPPAEKDGANGTNGTNGMNGTDGRGDEDGRREGDGETGDDDDDADDGLDDPSKTVLRTHYRAATNRMLRVSVNGFFESLAVVLQCMEELDVDVLAPPAAAGA